MALDDIRAATHLVVRPVVVARSRRFAADDTEYNSLNTDRELMAIRAIAKSLERVDQRKSMIYFSGGLTRNGIENQASLRAATNEAGVHRNTGQGGARAAAWPRG